MTTPELTDKFNAALAAFINQWLRENDNNYDAVLDGLDIQSDRIVDAKFEVSEEP